MKVSFTVKAYDGCHHTEECEMEFFAYGDMIRSLSEVIELHKRRDDMRLEAKRLKAVGVEVKP